METSFGQKNVVKQLMQEQQVQLQGMIFHQKDGQNSIRGIETHGKNYTAITQYLDVNTKS